MPPTLTYNVTARRCLFTLNHKGLTITSNNFYRLAATGMILAGTRGKEFGQYAMRVAADAYGYNDTAWMVDWLRQEYEGLQESIMFIQGFDVICEDSKKRQPPAEIC